MKLMKHLLILLILLITAIVVIPIVTATPDNPNHDGMDKGNTNSNFHDDEKNCDNSNHYDGIDTDGSHAKDKDSNHDNNRDDDKNQDCHISKNAVPIKNSTLAANYLINEISTQSSQFADWNGASAIFDTTYQDMTGLNSSYSYDVMKNGNYAGYVIVSATRDNSPILEFSNSVTPDKDPATL